MSSPTKHSLAEFDLTGKSVLMTGALGLIGSEVSDALAAAGANLALADIASESRLDERARTLGDAHGVSCLGLHADVSDGAAVAGLVEATTRGLGGIDVLIHLAAIDTKFDSSEGSTNPTVFHEYPLEMWQKSVDINMTGTLLTTQHVIRQMVSQGHGNVILIASTYSLVAPDQSLYVEEGNPSPQYKPVDYVATKSFVPNFARYLATSYAEHGIRVNCIALHGVESGHPKWFLDNFSERSPLGRMCKVSELRGPFVFLASDASSYMTGSTLLVDGGWTAR